MTAKRILLITKGHPFEQEPFFALFDAMADVDYTHVEQPAAQHFFHPDRVDEFDAFVLYDMPGISFGANGAEFVQPSAEFVDGFEALLAQGFAFVFLHHAVAGWPAWPRYAEIIGAQFKYLADETGPDSGYRHHVTHQVTTLADHPVTAGIDSPFTVTDELYLYQTRDQDITPLLASDYDFVDSNFYSAQLAVRGQLESREGWSHPQGSPYVGWYRFEGVSPIVYLQMGDDPVSYANDSVRALIRNAIHWSVGAIA